VFHYSFCFRHFFSSFFHLFLVVMLFGPSLFPVSHFVNYHRYFST
jgi:hypothetical protein